MNEVSLYVNALLIVMLALISISLITISVVFNLKVIRLAGVHAKGYLIPYKQIKTMAEAMDRTNKDFGLLIKTPNEFNDKRLVKALRVYRSTYWTGLLFAAIVILIPSL